MGGTTALALRGQRLSSKIFIPIRPSRLTQGIRESMDQGDYLPFGEELSAGQGAGIGWGASFQYPVR